MLRRGLLGLLGRIHALALAAGAVLLGLLRRVPGFQGAADRLGRVEQEDVGRRLGAATDAVVAHPRRALLAGLLVILVAAFAVTRLDAGAPPSLLADDGTPAAQATSALERDFGGEPIVVLVKGDLADTLQAANMEGLFAFEQRLAGVTGVQTVFGPGTFVGQTIGQISKVITGELGPRTEQADQAAAQAAEIARREGRSAAEQQRRAQRARDQTLGPLQQQYEQLLSRYGYVGLPSFDNQNFLSALILGASSQPKERFAWIFPDREHAIIAVRPRAGLSDDEVQALGQRIERFADNAQLRDLQLTVGGAPLVVSGLTDELTGELPRIGPVALLAMALVLLVGLGVGWRSLATLLPAAVAVLLTAALSWIFGLGLTPATIAALPVVLGLTVDYAVQLQARYRSQRAEGRAPPEAAHGAIAAVGPVLLLAGGVMAVGFLTLTVSSVPLVDRLGLTMAIGVVCGLGTALVLTGPLLALRDRGAKAAPELSVPRIRVPVAARSALVVLAVLIPTAGLALAHQSQIESDVQKLAPRGMPELEAINVLERELGSAGQLRVSVRGDDVTRPEVIRWMNDLGTKALADEPRLTAGPNLAAILARGSVAQGVELTSEGIASQLRLVPPGLVSAALSRDRKQSELSFGMPLLSGDEQREIIEDLQPLLDSAPDGVDAQFGGIIALSSQSVTELQDGRPWLLLGAALVIFLLLFAVRRRVERALVPLVPALLTAGTSSLVVVVSGMNLSPLSAGLEPLVLAVGVEFGLLLESRYHEERQAGRTPEEAARRAGRLVGAPVAVAALTVAAGFAVLGASRLGVLQQFGLLAAAELIFCAAVAILLVPALAARWDRGGVGAAALPPPATVRSRRVPAGTAGDAR